jgi:hypothetical protein
MIKSWTACIACLHAGRARRRRRAAARAAAAATSGVQYDVGTGVSLPDGDWLVPLKGATQLAVELEMPGSPQPDMVQVSCSPAAWHVHGCAWGGGACVVKVGLTKGTWTC